MQDLFNEWHAKNTSQKVRNVFKSKGNSGIPLTTNPPYGYLKDPEDKNHWVVDEEAAEIVRRVFQLCIEGYGPTQIAGEINKLHVMNPTAHLKSLGVGVPDNRLTAGDYTWQDSTIVHMLSRMEYLGHTVNFKTYRKSYKNKKQLKNDPSEWKIFENTHEAIIDQETYNIVQRIRDGRRRVTPMGEMPVLSGMVFCGDCGKKLYQVRGRNLPQKEYMVCSTYRKVKGGCSSHQIRNEVLERFILEGIQSISAYVRDHEEEFIELVTQKTQSELNRSMRDWKKELEQAQTRIRKLDEIIQHLYEDKIEGTISDERFSKMSASYETEQAQLEARVTELKRLISAEKDCVVNVNTFIELVKRRTEIKELTAEVIREYVEKVIVFKPETIDGVKTQHLKIIWNCIGEFVPPIATEIEISA